MLNRTDNWLMQHPPEPELKGLRRFLTEFWFFGLKEARACLFAGLIFAAIFAVPKTGLFGLPRYDVLLVFALAVQAAMIRFGLETWDELKAVSLFHIVGFVLEVFKTSAAIQSWTYPEFAYTKIFNVPLFTGFMYAAVGSYIIQAWRLFDLKISGHPPYWLATLTAVLIYLNFFTHHYIGDYRWYLAAFALGLYARTRVSFTPYDKARTMPLLLAFFLIGFFIWLAENLGTFAGIWRYPNQMQAWSVVHLSKWSAWALLVVMTFTIVVHLKHIKASVGIWKD